MNKKVSTIIGLLLCISHTPIYALWGKASMQRVYAFFGKYTNEEVIEKEYQLEQPGTLIINNVDGNITISTEWKKDSICLKATKRASKAEDLKSFEVDAMREEQFDGHHLTLSSSCKDRNAKGAIDYELLVPAHIKLSLHTDRGVIKVQDVNGPITANTINGNIELKNITNTITAQTDETGSILIDKPKGNIKVATNKGEIRINEAAKSILAQTTKGNITTACNTVPAGCKLVMNAEQSGTITLALPSKVSATLLGKTEKGRLTSDHFVTIKPFTTQLNRKTRREFERKVDGVLGSGEADIRLTCNSGNIKIIETKTT